MPVESAAAVGGGGGAGVGGNGAARGGCESRIVLPRAEGAGRVGDSCGAGARVVSARGVGGMEAVPERAVGGGGIRGRAGGLAVGERREARVGDAPLRAVDFSRQPW